MTIFPDLKKQLLTFVVDLYVNLLAGKKNLKIYSNCLQTFKMHR